MASLANSLGWKFMIPSGIQRREWFTTLPMNGSSTTTSSSSATPNSSGACFSQKATGTCTASSAATTPMASASTWRCRKKWPL